MAHTHTLTHNQDPRLTHLWGGGGGGGESEQTHLRGGGGGGGGGGVFSQLTCGTGVSQES